MANMKKIVTVALAAVLAVPVSAAEEHVERVVGEILDNVAKIKSADPRISSVKVFMREGDLVCDIYVADKAYIEDDWQAVIDRINEGLSKYEKIRKYSVGDVASLLKG